MTGDAPDSPADEALRSIDEVHRRERDGLREEVARLRGALAKAQGERIVLVHRVRNTLGVIRSIARWTAATSTDVEDYAAHLDGRIGTVARVQAAVMRDPAGGLELAGLVADELLLHGAREAEGVRIEGPEIWLQPKPAETLALAVHELATNAVKYGALSAAKGHLAVTWRTEDRSGVRWLVLDWIEGGVPHPQPAHRGFGTNLLERTLPDELEAEVRHVFTTDGVCWVIALPMVENIPSSTRPD